MDDNKKIKNKYSMSNEEYLKWSDRKLKEVKKEYSKLSPEEKRQEELLNKEIEEDVKWDYNRFQIQKEIL